MKITSISIIIHYNNKLGWAQTFFKIISPIMKQN